VSERLCSKCKNEPAEPRQRWGRNCFNAYKRTRTAARMLRRRGAPEREDAGRVEGQGTALETERPVAGEAVESQAPPSPPVGEKDPPADEGAGVTRSNRGNGAGNARNAPPSRAAIAPEWIYEAPERFVPFRDTPGHGPAWAVPFLADYAVHGGQPLAASRAGVTMKTVEREAHADSVFAEEVDRALEYHRALLEWESLNLGRCKHSPLPFFDRMKAEMPSRHVDRALIGAVNVNVGTGLDSVDAVAMLRAMLGDLSPATRQMIEASGSTIIDVPPALPEAEPR
jgi:hypothetical protein